MLGPGRSLSFCLGITEWGMFRKPRCCWWLVLGHCRSIHERGLVCICKANPFQLSHVSKV